MLRIFKSIWYIVLISRRICAEDWQLVSINFGHADTHLTGASSILDGARLNLSSFERSTLKYIRRDAIRPQRASEGKSWGEGQRDGEKDAEWTRTRRGSHTGVKYRLPSVAGVADRDTGAVYAGRGRHEGVDKVAIAHGTQLHAPD